MNFIKIIFKTYLASTMLSFVYLWLVHSYFYTNEIGYVMLALLFGNIPLNLGYVVAILIPFNFLFKHIIAANTFNEVLNKYLFFFSIIPMFLTAVGINLILNEGNNGMQFSVLIFDLCSIIYIGFINLLKYKTAP
jgi:hypothetical protein